MSNIPKTAKVNSSRPQVSRASTGACHAKPVVKAPVVAPKAPILGDRVTFGAAGLDPDVTAMRDLKSRLASQQPSTQSGSGSSPKAPTAPSTPTTPTTASAPTAPAATTLPDDAVGLGNSAVKQGVVNKAMEALLRKQASEAAQEALRDRAAAEAARRAEAEAARAAAAQESKLASRVAATGTSGASSGTLGGVLRVGKLLGTAVGVVMTAHHTVEGVDAALKGNEVVATENGLSAAAGLAGLTAGTAGAVFGGAYGVTRVVCQATGADQQITSTLGRVVNANVDASYGAQEGERKSQALRFQRSNDIKGLVASDSRATGKAVVGLLTLMEATPEGDPARERYQATLSKIRLAQRGC